MKHIKNDFLQDNNFISCFYNKIIFDLEFYSAVSVYVILLESFTMF